jgi:hypothetical protein
MYSLSLEAEAAEARTGPVVVELVAWFTAPEDRFPQDQLLKFL